MRLLTRNLKWIEYLPCTGETDIDPETGLHTGEMLPSYGKPLRLRGNISTPSQYVNATFYGEDIRFTHTLILEIPPDKAEAEAINEYGIIRYKGEKYNIRAVRPSLNFLSLALQKQTVNHAGGEAE